MRIGIVGGGVVGSALARAFSADGFAEVGVYDLDPARRTHELVPLLANAKLTFVCLPTPQKPGTLELDTTALDDFFATVKQLSVPGVAGRIGHRTELGDLARSNFVIKSTVPVGYTRKVRDIGFPNVVHSPEFLTARTAFEDAADPRLNVIGTPGWKGTADNSKCTTLLEDLYIRRWPAQYYTDGVTYLQPIKLMSSDESEFMKLALNSFFATKVAFFNEANALAAVLGLNWGAVVGAMVAEGRIFPLHTDVPGPDSSYGFGGSCLPKDLAQFTEHLREAGLPRTVTTGALVRNDADRRRTA